MIIMELCDPNKQLLELIKQSLFNNGDIPEGDYDYIPVLKEARNQSILGIIVSTIPSGCYPKGLEWCYVDEKHKAQFLTYLHEQGKLKDILDQSGIPFVILKGCASAIYYDDPWKRSMGDIDFLVSPDDYELTKRLLLDNGFTPIHDEDIRNIPLKKNRLSYELHKQFSSPDNDIEDYIRDGFSKREMHCIDGYEFPILPELANGLVLLDHMRQHLIRGLGLRQIIDWMMYVNAVLDDSFWNNEFGTVAKQKGLDVLAITVTKMCKKHLGLQKSITWCSDAEDLICDELLLTLLYSGNFGQKQGTGRLVESVATAINRNGKIKQLQKAGENNWKAYKKHHWLKPFCWIYQANRYLVKGIKSGRSLRELNDDAKRGKNRADLLKKLGIS